MTKHFIGALAENEDAKAQGTGRIKPLRRITVRLLPAQDGPSPERERFERLLEEKHYLKSARLGGQSLR